MPPRPQIRAGAVNRFVEVRKDLADAVAAVRRDLLNASGETGRRDGHLARVWLGPQGARRLLERQQIIVVRRAAPMRLCFSAFDRVIYIGPYRLFPGIRDALVVVRPETVFG